MVAKIWRFFEKCRNASLYQDTNERLHAGRSFFCVFHLTIYNTVSYHFFDRRKPKKSLTLECATNRLKHNERLDRPDRPTDRKRAGTSLTIRY